MKLHFNFYKPDRKNLENLKVGQTYSICANGIYWVYVNPRASCGGFNVSLCVFQSRGVIGGKTGTTTVLS